MESEAIPTFLDHSDGLEDPRSRESPHDLRELLLVALCAVLSGADGWADGWAGGGGVWRGPSCHGCASSCRSRRIALNLIRQDTSQKVGVKNRRLLAGWDDAYRQKLLGIQAIA
jgi:hypothetical protein